ncbi:alpha/beta hydrolase [Oscillatoria sp. FACHB-1406]|uniref:alpha/beta fold hydrolase n=1 Tax=Oscillatoria sp. FACHB-1406 TaxID=2692846 RepID=UPI001682D21E|nr:alpha/beta hydrolase [Oscillatoria sp. FACHB-1406]MBD2576872.1 alpha/beta hydrolase [Oscillatoria sp. FACHB-1406]
MNGSTAQKAIEIAGVYHTYELTPPPSNPSAPVLVFIHGWLLSRQYWQPLVDRLAADYQCLTYDLRGFGDSQPSEGSTAERAYTLAAYAEDLSYLLEALGIDNAWSIGHSLGGSIALWGAKLCRDRIKGVIGINAGGGIYIKEDFERFRSIGCQLVKLRPRWLGYLSLLELLFERAMVVRPLERCWGRQRLNDFVRADARAALGSLLETTTEAEVHLLPQVVAHLDCPVYFLAGDRDPIVESKYVFHLASFHRLFQHCGANAIEIPECGHLAMLEQPDLVANSIRSILSASNSSLDTEQ